MKDTERFIEYIVCFLIFLISVESFVLESNQFEISLDQKEIHSTIEEMVCKQSFSDTRKIGFKC